jgi:hypothetical protein
MTRAAWSCEPESRIIVMVINVRSLVTGHNVNSVHQERAHLRRKLSALHSRCNAPRCHWQGRTARSRRSGGIEKQAGQGAYLCRT